MCTQIRVFHLVAVCGGFSSAALQTGQCQPALSDQVRRLEQVYDVLLFRCDGRRVRLPPYNNSAHNFSIVRVGRSGRAIITKLYSAV
ncbi:MAG: LysR family transcriptional regulator [Paracoccaceae bacterium]|nr:LysR family transcriptional regulator [Paracoccaceae bacterium]